ncbi:MAG: GGDEF domain-containing protein [Burkholderiales bacterium]
MPSKPLRVLAVHGDSDPLILALERSAIGPFTVHWFKTVTELSARCIDANVDALVLKVSQAEQCGLALGRCALNTAVVLIADDVSLLDVPSLDLSHWLPMGIQEILAPHECFEGGLARRLRASIERHRWASELRRAYSTDLGTGLPHEQQLIEHMSHLLALREREPASMSVLALRVEGLATLQEQHGEQVAAILRRKLAVRLRAAVRASDVVAAIDTHTFVVLLASVSSTDQAERVGRKLMTSLHAPLKVGGHDLAVAIALGISQYPKDGVQPAALLHRAISDAAAMRAEGRSGFVNFAESGVAGSANDA